MKGGLENFVLHYPMLVVNPEKARNPPERYVAGKNKGKSKGLEELASTIAYPDFDTAFIGTPSPAKDYGIAATETLAGKSKTTPSSAIEITSVVNINRYTLNCKVLGNMSAYAHLVQCISCTYYSEFCSCTIGKKFRWRVMVDLTVLY